MQQGGLSTVTHELLSRRLLAKWPSRCLTWPASHYQCVRYCPESQQGPDDRLPRQPALALRNYKCEGQGGH